MNIEEYTMVKILSLGIIDFGQVETGGKSIGTNSIDWIFFMLTEI
jgi:hypothetical protein